MKQGEASLTHTHLRASTCSAGSGGQCVQPLCDVGCSEKAGQGWSDGGLHERAMRALTRASKDTQTSSERVLCSQEETCHTVSDPGAVHVPARELSFILLVGRC